MKLLQSVKWYTLVLFIVIFVADVFFISKSISIYSLAAIFMWLVVSKMHGWGGKLFAICAVICLIGIQFFYKDSNSEIGQQLTKWVFIFTGLSCIFQLLETYRSSKR
jgi:hypothetical protein